GAAPDCMTGAGSVAERQACRAAWDSWWERARKQVDWHARRQDFRRPGLLILCNAGAGGTDGKVWLTGCDGQTRWQLTGLARPRDARLLPGPRILTAALGTAATGGGRVA